MIIYPSSVIRLQFNEQFSLKKASSLLPYFHALGFEGIYGSPIFVSNQPHGYDVADPLHLNPTIGTHEDFEEFINQLQSLGMSYVLDVVPNHMATKNNHWWTDVMEKGLESSYADFFDIDWMPEKPQLHSKVLLPFLHDFYGRVLRSGMIQLIWDQGFWIKYQDLCFPIAFFTYPHILKVPILDSTLSDEEYKEWSECLDIVDYISKLALDKNRHEKGEQQKNRLKDFYIRSSYMQKRMIQILEIFNKTPDLLHELLEKQYYRLSYWAVAGQEINYRRFFNINELISIHIEKKSVLEAHHRWVFHLVESKKVQGLRIDHPDGLYDPKDYFDQLQYKKPDFVVIEKILDFDEKLPLSWNIQGTVGYDFLNVLNGLFIDQKHEKDMTAIYEEFIGQTIDFDNLLYERKKWFLNQQMASEINALGWRLDQLAQKNKDYRDFTRFDLTKALKEIVACFPVYRTYVNREGKCLKRDNEYIIKAIEKAQLKTPEIDPSLYAYIRNLLLGESKEMELMDFVLRFQQVTGPVMAKGLEDSCFYIYNRLISLNEVGGNPRNFGISKSEFHDFNFEKLANWPLGFLATSTHDTKCSEDVRFRLNVLSEIPDQWKRYVNEWKQINHQYKKQKQILLPDENSEYYLYQMLLGLWAIDKDRFWICLHKAVREAGIYTSWRWPNLEYEEILKEFVHAILTPHTDNAFLPSFENFQKKIANYGKWNSLSALVLKMGSCGIVDIYQGNECENLRMMDPDNRQPVDYEMRKMVLEEPSHSLKFFITSMCLNFRRKNRDMFLKGSYTPLTLQGKYQEEAIAFLRSYKNDHVLIVASRFFTHFSKLPLKEVWEDTRIILPEKFSGSRKFFDLFSGSSFSFHKSGKHYYLFLSDLFQKFPFSLASSAKNTS